MPLLSRAETQFLNQVCHVTLDPAGPGVVRIHLVPNRHRVWEVPFVAILNGRDILPLRVSWAILLANFIEALHAHEGETLTPEQRDPWRTGRPRRWACRRWTWGPMRRT